MSSKREHSDLDDGEISEPDTKRAKKQQPTSAKKSRQHQNSGIDPTWGQKYVFSGSRDATTIPAGEESDFEDDADAMAYLMSVREEAYGIPHLLVAPKVQIGPQLPADYQAKRESDNDDDNDDDCDEPVDRSIYYNDIDDSKGWYEDGAYIAAPDPKDEEGEYYDEGEVPDEDERPSEKAVHDAYFTSILDQYTCLRNVLNTKPPKDAYSRLPRSTPIEARPFERSSSTLTTWSRRLRNSDPLPLQLALMSKDSILRVIRVMLGGKFLRRGYNIEERTSRWLWALLARLPDRGELNYAEIGWVRDLGRRAVLLGRSLAEMAALRDELAEGALGVHEGVDESSSGEDQQYEPDDEELACEYGQADDPDIDDGPSGKAAVTPPPSDPISEPPLSPPDGHLAKDPDEHTKVQNPEKLQSENGALDDEEDEDVAMDLASNSSLEEGEAPEEDCPEGLEAVKARLLARLDSPAPEDAKLSAAEEATLRARMNMRATLNMILTVAGEFYGQRDLLEFREPFVGM